MEKNSAANIITSEGPFTRRWLVWPRFGAANFFLWSFAALTVTVPARADDAATCARVVRQRSSYSRVDALLSCMDFYFSNPEYDEPEGSFNNILKLGARVVEVDPLQASTYTNVAWLMWSKWVTWKDNPERMPDGADMADRAVAFLRQGEQALANDALYRKDEGDTIWPLAQFHLPDLYAFVIESYRAANALTADPAVQVRVRLNLGHVYKQLQQNTEAATWYRAVLEVDPDNAVAKRSLAEVGG